MTEKKLGWSVLVDKVEGILISNEISIKKNLIIYTNRELKTYMHIFLTWNSARMTIIFQVLAARETGHIFFLMPFSLE